MPKEEEIVSIQLKSVDPATRDALHQASLSRFEGQKKKKKINEQGGSYRRITIACLLF